MIQIYPHCYLLLENGNHFSILLENDNQLQKSIITTPTDIKDKIKKNLIKITKKFIGKK